MLRGMDGPALIGDLALYSCTLGDGGPQGFRQRGVALPEKYLPGRFLAGLRPEMRANQAPETLAASPSRPSALS